jgi:hypothetical protein
MNEKERIKKSINSCQLALNNIDQGNKRLAVGDLDYAHEYIESVKWLLINSIKDEEGEF